MPHMDPLTALLTIVFIARVTRLIVADQILYRPRVWVVLRYGPNQWFAYLITCAWCSSIWVGAATVVAAYWYGDTRWWFFMVLAGAASYAAGVMAARLDPADD